MTVRFWRTPKLNIGAPSKQRLSAARRALARERERAGMFVDQLGPTETPEERVARQDQQMVAWWQRMRDSRAQMWRESRRVLFSLPPEQRRRIRDEWCRCGWPGTVEYFAEFLRWQLNGKRWNYQVSQRELQELAFAKDESGNTRAVEEQLALF